MFKSGLEEKVSDLLCELGVNYEYEGTSFPILLPINTHLILSYPMVICLELKGSGDQKIDAKT